MANKVEQEILVKIKTVIEGLNEVKQLASSVQNLGKGGGGRSLTGDFVKAGVAAGSTAAIVNKLLGAVVDVGEIGGRALAGFVTEGIRFNATIESAKIGIATLVANTYDVRDASGQLLDPIQSFNASLEKSEELERALQKSAIETKFEFQDVLSFFNSSVLASAGLKTNLEQIVSLTQGFALAAGAANIDVEKVNTGIKQILTGNTTVRNDLARVLFPGLDTKSINETLKKQREAGTLVDFLQKKLEVFKLSGDQVAQSFDAVASNVKDAFKVFEAASTLPLFDKIKQTLGFIINQVVDLSGDTVKLTPTFQKIADILGDVGQLVGEELLSAVKAIFGFLGDVADYLVRNQDAVEQTLVNVFAIAEQIGGIVIDMASIVGDLGRANSSASGWASVTQFIALTIGFIRDLLNIIIGTAEGIVGVFTQMAAIILNGISAGLLDLINRTKGWLNVLLPVALVLGRIASAVGAAGEDIQNLGTDRLVSGLNFDSLANAATQTNRTLQSRTPNKHGNFSFSPRTNAASGAGGSGAGAKKRAEEERLRDARKLFDEIEKYNIANARREVELVKDTNRLIQSEIERRYDKGIIAAEDFYRQKKQLAIADLEQEKAALGKEQKAADAALARDLGAIQGKFALSADELNAILDKLDPLLEGGGITATTDAKTIKQAQEYIKYQEQTAAISQKLKGIEFERKRVIADTTDATEKATRANKTLLDSLASEFATSQGNDGLGELFNLQKRISDEFPKILTETNKTLPGIKELATDLQKAGEVDISSIPASLDKFGIKFEDLSDEARLFIKLLERLEALARLKSVSTKVQQAQDTFKTATGNTSDDFNTGRIGAEQALNQIQAARKPLVDALTKAYSDQLDQLIQLQAEGIATPQDIQAVEQLRRAVAGVTDAVTAQKLAIIDLQAQRDRDRFDTQAEAVKQAQRSGDTSAVQARQQILAIQKAQVAALEQELVRLSQLDQELPEVAQKIADTKNQISTLRNDVNSEFEDFAKGVNSQVGGAFSDFLTTLINGTESIGDAFRKMLSGLLLGIANAIAQSLLLKYILRPLGLGGGDDASTGGLGGLLGGFLKHADGGILSGPGTGVSDSIPILASHGEGIIPARRVRQYGTGIIQSIINGSFVPRISLAGFAGGVASIGGSSSGGGRGATRIINTVDPNLVSDFMQSAAGEEIILNIIGKNPGVIQRLA